MSVPVFSDPALVAQLDVILRSWERTPFFPRMARRGVGVDCVRFAAEPLLEMQLVRSVNWPRYSVKGGGPELIELCLALIAEAGLQRVWQRGHEEVLRLPGDVLFVDRPVHFAILGSDLVPWQCWYPHGVIHAAFGSEHDERLHSIHRVFAV